MYASTPLILVPSAGLHAALVELAGTLSWTSLRTLSFEIAEGEPRVVVAACRERAGDVPIGYVAQTEHDVLEALAGGADEAAVLPLGAAPFAAFVDRMELRARLRAETTKHHHTLANAEKLTALGTLVAGIGHEINNPLTAVTLSIEALRLHVMPLLESAWEVGRAMERGESLEVGANLKRLREIAALEKESLDTKSMFEEMTSATYSIAAIVRDLRVFARSEREELPEVVEVSELVDQAIRLVGREVMSHGLIERDYAQALPRLVLPRNRVMQVLTNVLVNAAHAIREIERPVHRVRINTRADDDFVAIAISDTGPGIPLESLERIFDPFYSTKRQEIGTGLGLAISRTILRRMGGDLAVESIHGDGATFIALLPLPSKDDLRTALNRTGPIRSTLARRRGASVLVVDEDERVLRSYARVLHPDHRILFAHDGTEAIEMLESGSMPDIIVSEIGTAPGTGSELYTWLSENRLAMVKRLVLVTSSTADAAHAELLRSHPGPVLHKPVKGEELLHALEDALA